MGGWFLMSEVLLYAILIVQMSSKQFVKKGLDLFFVSYGRGHAP